MGKGVPFAARAQATLIVLLLLSLVLIAQQESVFVYQAGLLALLLLTVVQIAFGNVRPSANIAQSLTAVAITVAVVGGLVALAIYLVPFLTSLGR